MATKHVAVFPDFKQNTVYSAKQTYLIVKKEIMQGDGDKGHTCVRDTEL